MAGTTRDQRMRAAIERVLDPDEEVRQRGWCWAVVRRPHVPLLLLGRRRYDAFLTDRRMILVVRRLRRLRPSDVTLVKRFDTLVLEQQHGRPTLLQQRIRTDQGDTIVVEWPRRSRPLGRTLATALSAPVTQARA